MMILSGPRRTWTPSWRVAEWTLPPSATWIGVAGTATTLAGVYLELEQYDRERVHGASIPMPAIAELLQRLAGLTVDEIRALPSMHPGRADVITGGALVATRIAARLQVEDLIVSESDILDGIALQLLDR